MNKSYVCNDIQIYAKHFRHLTYLPILQLHILFQGQLSTKHIWRVSQIVNKYLLNKSIYFYNPLLEVCTKEIKTHNTVCSFTYLKIKLTTGIIELVWQIVSLNSFFRQTRRSHTHEDKRYIAEQLQHINKTIQYSVHNVYIKIVIQQENSYGKYAILK